MRRGREDVDREADGQLLRDDAEAPVEARHHPRVGSERSSPACQARTRARSVGSSTSSRDRRSPRHGVGEELVAQAGHGSA